MGALNKRWFILEGFYTSDSRGNSNRQPYEGLHVSLTCQQGTHPSGLISMLYSHTTVEIPDEVPAAAPRNASRVVQIPELGPHVAVMNTNPNASFAARFCQMWTFRNVRWPPAVGPT
jgi:hypothetical protein